MRVTLSLINTPHTRNGAPKNYYTKKMGLFDEISNPLLSSLVATVIIAEIGSLKMFVR